MTRHSVRPAADLQPGSVAQTYRGGPVLVIRHVETIPVQYRSGTSAVRRITAYDPAGRRDVEAYVPLQQNWRVYR